MLLEYQLGYKTIIKECPESEIMDFVIAGNLGKRLVETNPKGEFWIIESREDRFILKEYRKNK